MTVSSVVITVVVAEIGKGGKANEKDFSPCNRNHWNASQ